MMTIGKGKGKPDRQKWTQTTCTYNTSQQILVLREYLRNKEWVFCECCRIISEVEKCFEI